MDKRVIYESGVNIKYSSSKAKWRRSRRGTISRANVETTNKILLRKNEPPSKTLDATLKERRSND